MPGGIIIMKEEQGQAGENYARSGEHPPLLYSTSEIYTIRKESINSSNDQIYKRLSRQFGRIKKIRSQPNAATILAAEFDYDSCPIRRDFRRLHDCYNQVTKTNLIVKKRIDKMRNKVDQIKSAVEKDQFTSVREVDFNKIISKPAPTAPKPRN